MIKVLDRDALRLLVEMYREGNSTIEIAKVLNDLGYTSAIGSKIHTSVVSTFAHKAGCEKRLIRTPKVKKAVKVKTKLDIGTILAIANSNLPENLKSQFLKMKLV